MNTLRARTWKHATDNTMTRRTMHLLPSATLKDRNLKKAVACGTQAMHHLLLPHHMCVKTSGYPPTTMTRRSMQLLPSATLKDWNLKKALGGETPGMHHQLQQHHIFLKNRQPLEATEDAHTIPRANGAHNPLTNGFSKTSRDVCSVRSVGRAVLVDGRHLQH